MNSEFFQRRVTLANEITDSTSRGSAGTMYANQGVSYGGELSDAAKKSMVFLTAVEEAKIAKGFGQYFARFRAIYDDADDVTLDSGEYVTSDLNNYAGNFKDGIWITPAPYSKSTEIGYVADQRSIDHIDPMQAEQLSYIYADSVDQFIASALASATEMTNSVRGATLIYAGQQTSDDAITSSDTFSVSLLNEADTRLKDKNAFYWNSNVWTASALKKNPWRNDTSDPFVFIGGLEQVKALRESSQFLSAAEYGGSQVLLNGEIGQIFNIRLVESHNIPITSANSAAWDTTTNTTVDLARCFLMKGRAAYVFVWGKEPEFETLKTHKRLSRELRVWGMYNGSVIHADAIVKMDVATNVSFY